MKMNVPDCLPAVTVTVRHNPESRFGKTGVGGEVGGNGEDVAGQGGIGFLQAHEGRDVLTGNDQEVMGCLGRDVIDGNDAIVLIDGAGPGSAVGNPAEDASI